MVKFYTGLLLTLLWLSVSEKGYGQTISTGDSTLESLHQIALNVYHKELGKSAHIYSGREYVGYSTPIEGHPFFGSDQWAEATVCYDNIVYKAIPLLYDVTTDALVLSMASEDGIFKRVEINAAKVSAFSLSDHTFVHLHSDSIGAPPVSSGFYDLLYNGTVKVYAKRQKYAKKEVVTFHFIDNDKYYIFKDGQYHPVKSKASVNKVLKGHKKALNKFLRENNLIFHQNRELSIAKMAEKFDALNNQ